MQKNISEYLEQIMNSGLSNEEKEVLMSELSKELLKERKKENNSKISYKEHNHEQSIIASVNQKSGPKTTSDIKNKDDGFDIIDFCNKNNIKPIELGRIIMTPVYEGLSNKQVDILIKYLNDPKINENIKEWINNKYSLKGQNVENYKNNITNFNKDNFDDAAFEITRTHMTYVITNQQNVVHEIIPDEFLDEFAKASDPIEGYNDEYGFSILNRAFDKMRKCYTADDVETIFMSNERLLKRAKKIINPVNDFGVKACSDDNSTTENILKINDFTSFCKGSNISSANFVKIMFSPSYECLTKEELSIVDKLLPIAKEIQTQSEIDNDAVVRASNIIDIEDIFNANHVLGLKPFPNVNSLEEINRYDGYTTCDNKRLCFDTMRMMLSPTFLENYDTLVPEDVRNSIDKVSPMKTVCDYGSFMDKMKAMYGYRRSLEDRIMTEEDRNKLYNETIPNMNDITDKLESYGISYSYNEESSRGAR